MTAGKNETGLPLQATRAGTSKQQTKTGMPLELDLLGAIDDDPEILDVLLCRAFQNSFRRQQEDRNGGKVEALAIEVRCRMLDHVAIVVELAGDGPRLGVREFGLCRNLGAKASNWRVRAGPVIVSSALSMWCGTL